MSILDRAVGPDGDGKRLLIMAKHLKVGQGHNEFKHVTYITTFREIFQGPALQSASGIILALRYSLGRGFLVKANGLRGVLKFDMNKTL